MPNGKRATAQKPPPAPRNTANGRQKAKPRATKQQTQLREIPPLVDRSQVTTFIYDAGTYELIARQDVTGTHAARNATSPEPCRSTVYQFRVEISGFAPPIWRRIRVENCLIRELHAVLAIAMGRDSAAQFRFDGCLPHEHPISGRPWKASPTSPLSAVFPPDLERFTKAVRPRTTTFDIPSVSTASSHRRREVSATRPNSAGSSTSSRTRVIRNAANGCPIHLSTLTYSTLRTSTRCCARGSAARTVLMAASTQRNWRFDFA
jgi:hypothetical protein